MVLDLGQPGQHDLPVRLEQVEPLLLVAVAGADEVGVPADVADRHPGRAQLGDQPDPGEVGVLVAPVAGRAARHLAQQQAALLVVAERVRGQSGLVRSLGDGLSGAVHPTSVRLGVHSRSRSAYFSLTV